MRAAAERKILSNRRSFGRPALRESTLTWWRRTRISTSLTSAFGVWHEAKQAAKDQVEEGEQHRGILREHRVCA
jgi:hypothetical protein